MSSMLHRVVFFAVHAGVHVWVYVVPQQVLHRAWRWMRGRVCQLWKLVAPRGLHPEGLCCQDCHEDDIRVLASLATQQRQSVVELFGLQVVASPEKQRSSWANAMEYLTRSPCTAPHYGGHLHTILGAFRPLPEVDYSREVLHSFDGNRLWLDWMRPSSATRPKALILILPGLTGTSGEVYVRRMVRHLQTSDVAICVLHARGVGETPLDVPQTFSALFTSDVRHLLANELSPDGLKRRFGVEVPVIGLAFSLGGLILTNYVGEQGRDGRPSGLAAAITVTSPHHVPDGDAAMQKPLARALYAPSLCAGLRRYCERHEAMVRQLPGVNHADLYEGASPKIRQLRTVQDVDEHIIGPHFGFPDAAAYYAAASNFNVLRYSRTPQLCLVAADDPVTGPPTRRGQWMEECDRHPAGLLYVELPTGGHLGFMANPLAQWCGMPNAMETVIVTAVQHLIQTVSIATS